MGRITSWLARCEAEATKLPRETHQALLDRIRAGKTVGDARTELGISFDAANGIITRNITEAKFLRSEAI